MVTLRRIRSRVAESVRRFMGSSSSSSSNGTSPLGQTPRTLFFWPQSKRRNTDDSASNSSRGLTISTPDSSRSVSFEDAITWPYIDDEI